MLDRLAGLETEYVVRFHPDDGAGIPAAARPVNYDLFRALLARLRKVCPVAPAVSGKRGVFVANGGAVWFERARQGRNAALIEGATPECRGPHRLLVYQRAQDAVLSAAARDANVAGGEFTLCKSDGDAWGNFYGAQENYEVDLAAGWRLGVWRAGLVMLVPLMVVSWAMAVVLMMGLGVYYAAAAVVYPVVTAGADVVRRVIGVPSQRAVHDFVFGTDIGRILEADGQVDFLPTWVEPILYWGSQLALAPTALGLHLLGCATAYRPLRRQLMPFLVSRAVVCGSGRLERGGRYLIASKAAGVNCAAGVNEIFGLRPIVSFGHFLKALMFLTLGRSSRFPGLMSRRQRLQIALGDSNLCDEAEYLKVGTTQLVLDVIEAGEMPPVPGLRRPVRALRRIIGDPTLRARVRLAGGQRRTAVELQRFYLEACEAFVMRRPEAPHEAREILGRWRDVLDLLEQAPETLVGRVDWVTKKFLLRECGGENAAWEVMKKIDLRYHELAPDGYFERLRQAGVVREAVTTAETETAVQVPPPDSPAAERGRLIRSLAGDDRVRVSWTAVRIGAGRTGRVIALRGDGRGETAVNQSAAPR